MKEVNNMDSTPGKTLLRLPKIEPFGDLFTVPCGGMEACAKKAPLKYFTFVYLLFYEISEVGM